MWRTTSKCFSLRRLLKYHQMAASSKITQHFSLKGFLHEREKQEEEEEEVGWGEERRKTKKRKRRRNRKKNRKMRKR